MPKFILIDLDGTLTNTAHDQFKLLKDGQKEFTIEEIPVFENAKEFILKIKAQGNIPIIVSDSHPNYVLPIAEKIFGCESINLSDKPNATKTRNYIREKYKIENLAEEAFVIGDTWLDIELGRSLNCPTILTTFYKASSAEERDGIGNLWKHIKSGCTYMTDSYEKILEIIQSPIQYLLAAEAVFCNAETKQARKFYSDITPTSFSAFRSLGRQNAGECDKYGIADKYFEFHRTDRNIETVKLLGKAVDNYLSFVIKSTEGFSWDILTYVSDKKTTTPPNKMSQLHDLLNTQIKKEKLFHWKDEIKGSIKDQKHYKERKEFVQEFVFVDPSIDIKDKSVIVIDDQFTTGGTAFGIKNMLKDKGVKNILFVTLFYLISNVESERICPQCGKHLVVKIKRSDSSKFLSCPIPKYGGNGCGYLTNIN